MTSDTVRNPIIPVFHDLEAWVQGYFLATYRRTLGGEYRWCITWWLHAEAISRLKVLWIGWEIAHADTTNSLAHTRWMWELDHHLPILMGARGPFFHAHSPSTTNLVFPDPTPYRPDTGTMSSSAVTDDERP